MKKLLQDCVVIVTAAEAGAPLCGCLADIQDGRGKCVPESDWAQYAHELRKDVPVQKVSA